MLPLLHPWDTLRARWPQLKKPFPPAWSHHLPHSPPQHLLVPPAPFHRINGSSFHPKKGELARASFWSQTQPNFPIGWKVSLSHGPRCPGSPCKAPTQPGPPLSLPQGLPGPAQSGPLSQAHQRRKAFQLPTTGRQGG